MAIKTRAQLDTQIATIDDGGANTAAEVRTTLTDIMDSGTNVSSGAGAPATTPEAVGDIYIDTTADTIYVATGTASSADWDRVSTLAGTETLTNKTLTTPTIAGATISADLDPNADGTINLGNTTNRYAAVHTDSIDLNGTTISGTTGDSGVLEDLVTLGAATADNQALVSTAAGVLAWESGATLRTSLGLAIGTDVQAYNQDILFANTADQLTAAFTAAVDDDGTFTTGTYTPSVAAGSNFKQITNNGAFTFAPPTAANDEAVSLTVRIINAASAGAITTSGFTQVTGDAFTTTNTHEFRCYVEVFDDGGTETSLLHVVAMQ